MITDENATIPHIFIWSLRTPFNVISKRQIKNTVQKVITERNRNNMLSFKKVIDRVSENSSDNKYLDRMGLTHSRI